MWKKTLLTVVAATMLVANANADFSAGDVQIIGFCSDDIDGIDVVTRVDISDAASLYFTNSGFFDDGTLCTEKGALKRGH